VAAGVAAAALVAAVGLVLLAVVAAVFLPLGDRAVATLHRTLPLLGHSYLLDAFTDRAGSLPTIDRNENL
jgi:putative exporter of polyketide antibiotics